MNRVEYRFIYNRKGKLNKEGKALIQIEAYLNPKRKYFSTGIYVTPKQWDDKKKIIKNHLQAQQLNWQLLEQMKQLQEFEMDMRRQKGEFDLSMFEILKNNESHNFWQLFDRYHETQDVSQSRKFYIRRTIKYLKEFNPNLSFQNFTLQTIYDFDYFLRKKGLHTNTVLQHHKITKHFLNLMVKSDVIKENPYSKYQIKREKTERVYLTEDELMQIEQLQLPAKNKRMQEVKDMFLFSCYTGLRYSDLQALKPENIETTDGQTTLIVRQKKTKDFVRIPISLLFNGKALEILNKYYGENKKHIFPQSSNQDTNRQLKLLQAYAGLNKTLTFHVSRHTFGTLLAKYTHDPYLIKELMGHSDIQTSMVYIHLSNEHVTERLKRVKWQR